METRHKGFLIPEAVIADMFRGKYLCRLKELYDAGKLSLSTCPEFQEPDAPNVGQFQLSLIAPFLGPTLGTFLKYSDTVIVLPNLFL